MHKRKHRAKKTVNNKLFNKKHMFWIAPLSITFGAIWISLAAYQVFGPTTEQVEQKERLDANAIKLEQI